VVAADIDHRTGMVGEAARIGIAAAAAEVAHRVWLVDQLNVQTVALAVPYPP
jgi:hypothetical protein